MANARPYEFIQYEAVPNMADIPAGALPARKPGWWISSGVPDLSEDSRTWTREQWDEHKRLANLDLVLQKQLMLANFEVRCDAERLTDIPSIYQTVFHRTGKFASTVEKLATSSVVANGSDGAWGQVACFLVAWTTGVLRHEAVRFHNFLQSQRESIYWILDNALLRILLSQWENDSSPSPTTTTTPGTSLPAPSLLLFQEPKP
ncbi:hypothetical protein N0V83_010602 [Neocucurbitaria cava]|uniref:Uncharacterized protein n=1 Tax=Neocucurbitaria cava TaxID=798079 RepID=A0A9W8XYU3_9PLEO|nr:hypothetical protein N0V83_010602 [Neocucurbitaria cava]